MKIIVTIDTEADDQWKKDVPLSISNVFALDRFQLLCEKHHIIPTYLITYEVASEPKAAAQFRAWHDAGRAEIGSHLHPWTTPPLNLADHATHTFPSELPDNALREKFQTLTQTVADVIGERPTSYRAGRWGFDMRQADLLQEFGYSIDLSITPKISWSRVSGRSGDHNGPDFRGESIHPRMLNERVLEVPMTVLNTGLFRREGKVSSWFAHLSDSFFAKVLNRLLFRRKWLRIFEDTTRKDWGQILDSAQANKLSVIVFMIHSSELVSGKSPYVPTEAALEHVYEMLEDLFVLCTERGIEGIAASGFARGIKLQN